MTARNPLYYDSGNLVEMSAAELLKWQQQAIYQYSQSKSVVITVNAGNGNIGTTMNDTRFRSSAATQQASSHATLGALDTVTTAFNHIVVTVTNPSVTGDTNNRLFPVYYDSSAGAIQSMSETDFVDTFIKPALVLMQDFFRSNCWGLWWNIHNINRNIFIKPYQCFFNGSLYRYNCRCKFLRSVDLRLVRQVLSKITTQQ